MIIGQTYFDRYQVVDRLGQGGDGTVYLVKNVKLGNEWAIKEIRKCIRGYEETELADEADILRRLNHPAIPKIIDIEADGEFVYIIEEYVEGGTLKAYKMSNEHISEAQIIDWGLQLAEVIQYLHGQQPSPIIFRDIKPENIMITNQQKLKLVDFGIAREYKPGQSKDTMPFGSKGYAPPEQYGANQSDERTDIFAIGVTLFFMVTGSNLGEMPYNLFFDKQLIQDISKELKRIIKTCCEPIPNDRYQTVNELITDLQNLNDSHFKRDFVKSYKPAKTKNRIEPLRLNQLHKTYCIGITGVAYGVGTTHTAIMLAVSLAKLHRVALVSMDSSGDFEDILLSLDHIKNPTSHTFNYKKVSYFWDVDYDEFWYEYKETFDFIIWDFGALSLSKFIRSFLQCDKHLVVAHGMDWKIKELLHFYEEVGSYDEQCKWRYIIPFCGSEEIEDIQSFIDNEIYTLPFHKNPFRVTKEFEKWVKVILTG